MINYIQYQDNTIRTITYKDNLWFCGQDFYKTLGLIWKGATELNKRKIPKEWVVKLPYPTNGGEQQITFITSNAIIRIMMTIKYRDEYYCQRLIEALGLKESVFKVNISESIFKNTVKAICDAFYLSCFFEFQIDNYRCDIFIPKLGIVEYNEQHHNTPTNKEKDFNKYTYLRDEKGLDVYICNIGDETMFYTRLIKKLMELGIDRKLLE